MKFQGTKQYVATEDLKIVHDFCDNIEKLRESAPISLADEDKESSGEKETLGFASPRWYVIDMARVRDK